MTISVVVARLLSVTSGNVLEINSKLPKVDGSDMLVIKRAEAEQSYGVAVCICS